MKKKSKAKPKRPAAKPRRPAASRRAGKAQRPKIIVRVSPEMRAPVGKAVAPIGANKIFKKLALREFRQRLLRLRERITGQIDFLASDNLKRVKDDNEVSFRSEEQGTDNFDRDFALNRVSSEQDVIFEIDEALHRIQLGTFGACEACNGPVEKARLSVLPYSRLCLGCQKKSEMGRKKFRPLEAAPVFPNADKAGAEAGLEEE